jgi:hypothetical protein
MNVIDQLKEADKTLESDGYNSWSYVRIALSEAINELQKIEMANNGYDKDDWEAVMGDHNLS